MTSRLTVREKEIADCLALGLTNKQIAEKLGISNQTVRNHLVNVFNKLGVKNRTQVAIRRSSEVVVDGQRYRNIGEYLDEGT